MRIVDIAETGGEDFWRTPARIEVTLGELDQIANALSQAIHEVDDWEFPILVGASVESVRTMIETMRDIVRQAESGAQHD